MSEGLVATDMLIVHMMQTETHVYNSTYIFPISNEIHQIAGKNLPHKFLWKMLAFEPHKVGMMMIHTALTDNYV